MRHIQADIELALSKLSGMVERTTGTTLADWEELWRRNRAELYGNRRKLRARVNDVMTEGEVSAWDTKYGNESDDFVVVWLPKGHPLHKTPRDREHGKIYYRLSPEKFFPMLGCADYIRKPGLDDQEEMFKPYVPPDARFHHLAPPQNHWMDEPDE